jgi:glycosyltransferase involved in cell wall biosynthesis
MYMNDATGDSFSIVYGTNIWSHHQIPLATELAEILGPKRFRMALFEKIHEERRRMGWTKQGEYPWVIGPPLNVMERDEIKQQCLEADVMIFGACPAEVLKERSAAGKLTLVASERLLKKRFHHLRMLDPRYFRYIIRYRRVVNHPNVHALPMGYYAPDDLQTIGAFASRMWKWGYFVDVNPNPPEMIPDRPVKVLWAGRMLKLKKLDLLLRALARIQESSWFGECLIIGDGPQKNQLLRLARRLGLRPDRVRFGPPVPFQEVRRLMRDSDVYVLPSNREEGWGAVAGEAMSEGCILLANDQAGAARDLIIEGKTGFLFHDTDVDRLVSLIERLGQDYPLRMRLRQQAWERMNSLWNPRVAAERLVALSEGLLGISPIPNFPEGPCSKT